MNALPISISPCPIAEAIFEMRFASSYPGDAIFGIVYNQFKDAFPKLTQLPVLQLPAAVREQDPGLRYTPHYRLAGEGYIMHLGPNVFSLSNVGHYRGWEVFFSKIKECSDMIFKLGIIERQVRTALRYINVFQSLNIFEKSTLSFSLDSANLGLMKTNLAVEIPYDHGVNNLKLINHAAAKIGNTQVHGSIIDIDTQVNLEQCADFEDAIDKAHSAEKKLFFSLLRKDFLDSLNPVHA